jgi:hypothetical protein
MKASGAVMVSGVVVLLCALAGATSVASALLLSKGRRFLPFEVVASTMRYEYRCALIEFDCGLIIRV